MSFRYILPVAVTLKCFALSSCSFTQGGAYHLFTASTYSFHSVSRTTASVGCDELNYFDTDRHRIDTAGKTPIVLIHGVTADKESWLWMIGKLHKEHRLIGIDLPGHGKSSAAADGDYRFSRQAERICLLMEQLNIERAHLLGHSMGGGIAMKFATLYPEKTVSLALIDPAGAEGQETEEFIQREQSGTNPLIVSDTWSAADKIEYVTNGPRSHHFISRYFLWAYFNHRDRKRECRYRDIYATVSRETLSPRELRNIKQPVFILWGAGDRVLRPEMANHYHRHIPGSVSKPVVIDSGHCPIAERSGETAEAYLKFLRTLKGDQTDRDSRE